MRMGNAPRPRVVSVFFAGVHVLLQPWLPGGTTKIWAVLDPTDNWLNWLSDSVFTLVQNALYDSTSYRSVAGVYGLLNVQALHCFFFFRWCTLFIVIKHWTPTKKKLCSVDIYSTSSTKFSSHINSLRRLRSVWFACVGGSARMYIGSSSCPRFTMMQ